MSSEKRFIAVKRSSDKEPKAMFLCFISGDWHATWNSNVRNIIAQTIENIINSCQVAVVPSEGLYLVDAEDIGSMLEKYCDTEIELTTFLSICAGANRKVSVYKYEQLMQPLLPTAEQLTNEALQELARELVGDTTIQKITVTDENGKSVSGTTKIQEQVGSYQFKKMPSGEVEIRDYVVFYSPNKDEYKFYNVFSEEPKITIFGQSAILLTESAAEDMADVLSQNSPKSWFYYKADYFLRKEKQQSENDKPNADKG